ncbi:MAG: hypothetical protein IJV01_04495 [Bacteroidales bacterium]|nr:hypothetical protein [Bacteroidales bacterium]
MKAFFRLIPILCALALVSCKKDTFGEAEPLKDISVNAIPPASLTALYPALTVRDLNGTVLAFYGSGKADASSVTLSENAASVQIPQSSEHVYAFLPAPSGKSSAGSVPVSVPAQQSQAEAGMPAPERLLLAAQASVKGGRAELEFAPVAAGLVFNVFKAGADGSEQVQSITLTPKGGARICGSATLDLSQSQVFSSASAEGSSVSVRLVKPAPVLDARPADSMLSGGRIFAFLARQRYTGIDVSVKTNKGEYNLSSSGGQVFDAETFDYILVDLDLGSATVLASDGVDRKGFRRALSSSASDFDNPILAETNNLMHDIIPDFSRVGYHYSDTPIPDVAVKKTVSVDDVAAALAAGTYPDTTAFLQAAIDEVAAAGGGALLLKDGTYNTCRMLFLDKSNLVLRGESETKTIIKNRATLLQPVIAIGYSLAAASSATTSTSMSGRRISTSTLSTAGIGGTSSYGSVKLITRHLRITSRSLLASTPIIENYVPVGRMYVRVADPSLFSVGGKVAIRRYQTAEWISAIGMDKIASNGRNPGGVVQWSDRNFELVHERRVTAIAGDRIYLDAPVVMALDTRYDHSVLQVCEMPRVSEVGVENLYLDCTFNGSLIYKSGTYANEYYDEKHAWSGVEITNAEHCWVRNVTTRHMGYALVDLRQGARNVTVQDCTLFEPVSVVSGARRYALCCTTGSELCLFKNCTHKGDRHGCVTNGTVCGPNVYTHCKGNKQFSVNGSHQSWSNGTLFDCITSNNSIEIQDRGNLGTGHGWTGANEVIWNYTHSTYGNNICMSPWASAKNYCIGLVGAKAGNRDPTKDYYSQPVTDYYASKGLERPDGEWYPAQKIGEVRRDNHISLPHDASDLPEWWPRLTLTSFSDPLSLYQCQLEDRHARGVYLGNL